MNRRHCALNYYDLSPAGLGFQKRVIAVVLLLISLTGCGGTYADFGKLSWWIKAFLKSITVVVYDQQSKTEYIAGTFKTDSENIWDACRKLADSYARQNELNDWEYHCCGKTFWSDCVRI